ncbi:MAG: peptide chain release factor N(5)-glutamine methyltransferase [Muribaculaceae bacterium]|nr:peptide chain release factor N(5)-glutamine methyltransferase [Muribaculaceae bacterium]
MTLKQLSDYGISLLSPINGNGEAQWMMRIIFEHVKGWSRVDQITHADDTMSDFVVDKVKSILSRLQAGEPLQYITGDTYWHGMTLKVTPDVLIPRPETSELIDIIAADNGGSDLRVLDICTGSGCIAVALASSLQFPEVTGIDISDAALKVAAENASLRKAAVKFIKADALKPLPFPDSCLDIIVCNPPYVLESEKKDMSVNVLDHEPALALFVPDSDPLEFYRPVSAEAFRMARPGGKLYFEINPMEADAVKQTMTSAGWEDVEILLDMHGRKRFARGSKPRI